MLRFLKQRVKRGMNEREMKYASGSRSVYRLSKLARQSFVSRGLEGKIPIFAGVEHRGLKCRNFLLIFRLLEQPEIDLQV